MSCAGKEYALYKGEELLGIGTINELSTKLGVSYQTMLWYSYPVNARREKRGNRRILICLDDEEDD